MASIRTLIILSVCLWTYQVETVHARGGGRIGGGGGGGRSFGGGGGGISRPGGGGGISRPSGGGVSSARNRAGSISPSMSRSASPVKRPPVNSLPSRPSTGASRPNINLPNSSKPGTNRPNFSKPNVNLPNATKPGTNRPNVSRPNVNLPNTNKPGASRPNLDRPNQSRPGLDRPGQGRPSSNDLKDFLNLPGTGRPSTLPATNRPNIGDRPNAGNRPNIGNNINNRPNIGNRINTGDITINRNKQYNDIRNRWNNVNVNRRPFYNPRWWNNYPTTLPAWRWHHGWANYPPGWCWRHAGWAAFGTWLVWDAITTPRVYNYGSNVVYRDNYVYVDNQQVASVDEYYQQATSIAESVPEPEEEQEIEWMPLGVYAITQENATETGYLLQLAISKEGIVAGTLWNELSDEGRPIEGMVDRESQRVALKFSDGKNTDVVFETGLQNLTQDESTALVHYGSLRTDTWLMVRLPEESSDDAASPAGP